MALSQPPTTPDEPTALAVAADPEAIQRAAEANAAVVLVLCLLALVGGTQLLVAVLGHLA